MIASDEKSETESAKMAVEAWFCSVETASTKLGFNYPIEHPIIEAEKAAGIGPRWNADPNEEGTDGSPKTMGGQMKKLQGGES